MSPSQLLFVLLTASMVNLYSSVCCAAASEYPLPCFDPRRRHKEVHNETVSSEFKVITPSDFEEEEGLNATWSEDVVVDDSHLENESEEDEERHIYPVLWLFETEDEYEETPQVLAAIEEVFVSSANEAHGTDKVAFERAAVETAKHDAIEKEDQPEPSLFDTLLSWVPSPSEEGPGTPLPLGGLRGSLAVNSGLPAASEATLGARFFGWKRHKARRSTAPSFSIERYRYEYIAEVSLRCRFCGGDDLYYFGATGTDSNSSAPLLLEDEVGQYLTARAHRRWERIFCRKLIDIEGIGKPSRCYIKVDRTRELPPGLSILDEDMAE